jgi:DNA-binding NarL/FixJ family response regulator
LLQAGIEATNEPIKPRPGDPLGPGRSALVRILVIHNDALAAAALASFIPDKHAPLRAVRGVWDVPAGVRSLSEASFHFVIVDEALLTPTSSSILAAVLESVSPSTRLLITGRESRIPDVLRARAIGVVGCISAAGLMEWVETVYRVLGADMGPS